MTQIVQVNVSQRQAPLPSTLQRTGAFISQGGTTGAVGSLTLITQLADLTAILKPARATTSLSWSASVVTAVTAAPHGYPVGQTIPLVIAGTTPAAYSGTVQATITGTTGFTYPLVSNPGSCTIPGTYNVLSATELLAMGTTFFAQGFGVSVYVLELGPGDAAAGVADLSTFITDNPSTVYGWLTPRNWSDESDFIDLMASYESTTSKTYFWVTGTTANYTDFTDLMKCVLFFIEADDIPVTEFTAAAAFYVALNYDPSSTNMVTPYAFSYLFGVTPYPTFGNAALLATLKAASVNLVGTGSEGGIVNTILIYGKTKDGRDFNYWYSVDWVQINIDLDLANAVINGSNDPTNPLYYDQDGINRLQAVAQQTFNRGVSFGLVLPPVTVNAVPFLTYVRENPSDYRIGKYAGLSATYTPRRGFEQIIFNVVVSDFVTA